MDRNLALDVVRGRRARLRPFRRLGYYDGADRAATEAMRRTFGYMHMRGRAVIGEGERDERRCHIEEGDGD